jgi:adenosine deaminase
MRRVRVEGQGIEAVGRVTPRSAWVRDLPKIELHLHLEGAIRPQTVPSLSVERLGHSGPLAPGWENSYYTYRNFTEFMEQLTPRFPGTPAEYVRIARECFEDLVACGVIYTEVSVDLPVRDVNDDSRFWPVMTALEAERRRAEAAMPIRINFIGALMRTLPVEVAVRRTELAIEARDRGIQIVGIDLHGDEIRGPAEPFAPAFRLAEKHGLGLRAHAGEARGTTSIWTAINVLGVRRVAHGARAGEDVLLMDRLRRGDVTLEMCLTSNVRTAIVADLAAHPIRRFYEDGLTVTVNSDDPLPFFTNMNRECRLLVDEFGFTRAELLDLMLNAARAAFIPEVERTALCATLVAAYTEEPIGKAI